MYIKKHAIVDFIIRFAGCFVAFAEFKLSFKLKIILTIILFIINNIIEIIMLNKKDNIPYEKNYQENKNIRLINLMQESLSQSELVHLL
ncbi:hypothetical protein UT300007_25040 [Clostridium sp. CTA-7]